MTVTTIVHGFMLVFSMKSSGCLSVAITMAVVATDEVTPQLKESHSEGTVSYRMDTNLQQIIDEATKPQSASIIIIGQGTSSLASTIAGQKMNSNIEVLQVDQVSVNIINACGMINTSDEDRHNDYIAQLVGATIVANESNGVVIICIKMHGQLDKHTLATLALLHKRFGEKFWKHAIIALTNANEYNEEKWLKSHKAELNFLESLFECLFKLCCQRMTEGNVIERKFAGEMEKWKNDLREGFTATADQVQPNCHIGMTKKEFYQMKIPVIPTSQLGERALVKMKRVGYGHWFDILLIKCCQRLQGPGLRLHNERLSKLPPDVAYDVLYEDEYGRFLRNKALLVKMAESVPGISHLYTYFQQEEYYLHASSLPRFEMPNSRLEDCWKDTKKTCYDILTVCCCCCFVAYLFSSLLCS